MFLLRVVVAPNSPEQLLPGDSTPPPPEEPGQDVELLAGQLHFMLARPGPAGVDVDAQIEILTKVRWFALIWQCITHPLAKLFQGEWFDQIIRGVVTHGLDGRFYRGG